MTIELAKTLPVTVVRDTLVALLADPATQARATAAISDCAWSRGCNLVKQTEDIVQQNVTKPNEQFCGKKGRLAAAIGQLGHLLDKAERWINLEGCEAAFQLMWASVQKSADFEGRGSDGSTWQAWDDRADDLMSRTIDHIHNQWSSLDTATHLEMRLMQQSGSAYGCILFRKSLPKFEFFVNNTAS